LEFFQSTVSNQVSYYLYLFWAFLRSNFAKSCWTISNTICTNSFSSTWDYFDHLLSISFLQWSKKDSDLLRFHFDRFVFNVVTFTFLKHWFTLVPNWEQLCRTKFFYYLEDYADQVGFIFRSIEELLILTK